MIDIVVKDNIKEFTKKLDFIQKRQIPFATSRALNDTAITVQNAIVNKVIVTFNNRKKWWVKGNRRTGIRVDFSNKKRMPLKSSVYTKAYFAELQEKGGTKSPVNGSKLAVPTNKAPKSLRRSDGVKRALQQKAVFVDKRGVMRRMAKGKLKPLFTFTNIAQVKPRFGFTKSAINTTNRWFPRYFNKRLKQAIASAKI
ncbi:MAG: hypothetical protein AAF195_02130 [Pseudomonadota bacterium]